MSGQGEHGVAVNMIRPHMRDIPQFAFPEGFRIRTMRGDESALWTDIHRDSEELFEIADDLFMDQFGDDLPATQERCFFIVEKRGNRQRQPPMNADAPRRPSAVSNGSRAAGKAEDDHAVGTISAWYSRDFRGSDHGRIHWVAVRPAYGRRGLAKAGMSHAMSRLAERHERCWLSTNTLRLPAIRMYLDFGFRPDRGAEGALPAWREVRSALDHPRLADVE